MNVLNLFGCLAILSGCASAATTTSSFSQNDGSGGNDQTSSSTTTNTTSVSSTTSVGGSSNATTAQTGYIVSSSSTSTGGGGTNQYQKTDDEAVAYSLDQLIWEMIEQPTDENGNIQENILCQGSIGNVLMYGSSIPDDTGHVAINYTLSFTDCVVPNGWDYMSFRWNGVVNVIGEEYGNGFGNYLLIGSDGDLDVIGAVVYENGDISTVDESCVIGLTDTYDESMNIGGIYGTVCDRNVYVSEKDVYQ